MSEKLYMIPVNDAFDKDSECPVCAMYRQLEKDAIDFTLGPSYMEDDIRSQTTKKGFCNNHLTKLYTNQNRLGLALMLESYMAKQEQEVEKLSKNLKIAKPKLFGKAAEEPALITYLNEKSESCFVCDRINSVFERYIATIFYLYEHDDAFKKKYKASKGFCAPHYAKLIKDAPTIMSAGELDGFSRVTSEIYLENLKRVREDLNWFITKFDYRFQDEPWKNAKDALPRSITKTNGELL